MPIHLDTRTIGFRLFTQQLAEFRRARPGKLRRLSTLDLMAGGKPAFLASQLGHTQAQFWKTYATWIEGENDEAELQRILAGRAIQKQQQRVDE